MTMSGATLVQPDNHWEQKVQPLSGGVTCDWEVVGSIPNQGTAVFPQSFYLMSSYFIFLQDRIFIILTDVQNGLWFLFSSLQLGELPADTRNKRVLMTDEWMDVQ